MYTTQRENTITLTVLPKDPFVAKRRFSVSINLGSQWVVLADVNHPEFSVKLWTQVHVFRLGSTIPKLDSWEVGRSVFQMTRILKFWVVTISAFRPKILLVLFNMRNQTTDQNNVIIIKSKKKIFGPLLLFMVQKPYISPMEWKKTIEWGNSEKNCCLRYEKAFLLMVLKFFHDLEIQLIWIRSKAYGIMAKNEFRKDKIS